MDIINKWKEIVAWLSVNQEQEPVDMAAPITEESIHQIEGLLQEPVPVAFRHLYAVANGQESDGEGLLFGHRFMSATEIIDQLQFSRSLQKPHTPTIEHPEQSQQLVEKIVALHKSFAPSHKLFGLKKSWYKIESTCGVNSFGGPYLYRSEKEPNQREAIDVENIDPILEVVNELHAVEKPTYNWDELHVTLFANGMYKVQRAYYNFDEEIPFTSTPEGAIKKKYFHYKWLPIFSDYGGNYIGVDLDPDTKGTKGQVIIFGRDEEDMLVVANSLEDFLDCILHEIKTNNGKAFITGHHLHEVFKEQHRP